MPEPRSSESPKPPSWSEWRARNGSKPWCWRAPLAVEWALEWFVHRLRGLALFELLELGGKLTVLVAVILWFLEADNRAKERHYRAWELINAARGSTGDGGRRDALQDLNKDGVSLVAAPLHLAFLSGIDLEGADLEGVNLESAILWRANLQDADLRFANLQGATLGSANLRGANLRSVGLMFSDLQGASLVDVKLQDADLQVLYEISVTHTWLHLDDDWPSAVGKVLVQVRATACRNLAVGRHDAVCSLVRPVENVNPNWRPLPGLASDSLVRACASLSLAKSGTARRWSCPFRSTKSASKRKCCAASRK